MKSGYREKIILYGTGGGIKMLLKMVFLNNMMSWLWQIRLQKFKDLLQMGTA